MIAYSNDTTSKSNKFEIKRARVIYIRELSRFINRTIALLKKKSSTFEDFQATTEKSIKRLQNVVQVDLYKTELIKQKELANKIIAFAKQDNEFNNIDLDDIRDTIYKDSNTIHKNRNKNKKIRVKHKKSILEYD